MEYQTPTTPPTQAFEVTHVRTSKVVCEGVGGVLGHPRVYLTIAQEADSTICPYCSRMFIYDNPHHSHEL